MLYCPNVAGVGSMFEGAKFLFCFELDPATGTYETFASFSWGDEQSRVIFVETYRLDIRPDDELWLFVKTISESHMLLEQLRAVLLRSYPRPCTCTPHEMINACTALASAEELEAALWEVALQ